MSKEAIVASNADLKKSDMIKIGQKLVIIGLKDDKTIVKKDTKTETIVSKKAETPAVTEEKPKSKTEEAPKEVAVAPTPEVTVPTIKVETAPQNQNEDQGVQPQKPEGTIDGGYIWPFPEGVGRVSQGRHADNAYDFSAPKGTPIYAVQSGTVFIAHPSGYNGGFGLYVVINFDDGRQAIFGHMSKVLVTEGQTVKQGEVIGLVGSTGKSTGPHLHLGFHGPMSNPYLGLKVGNRELNHD
jgi:murein DD-endopeptidase MepM/ murein hydrolase activator NlpD